MADVRSQMAPTTLEAITATTTSPPNTTPAKGKTAASVGVVSAVVFLIIVVVLIWLKRRLHKNRSGSSSASAPESPVSEDPVHLATELDRMQRSVSITSQSLELPIWSRVDENLRKVVKGSLIECSQLQFKRKIGKGQFGLVYEAVLLRDPRSSNFYASDSACQKVAVKTLKGDKGTDSDTIEAFLREGLIMRDFHHDNVLSLIGVSLAEKWGMPQIVLPFMENGSLKKYIMRRDLELTVRELLDFALQVSRGMHYLSEKRFVHRDLAARNCMISGSLVVKVADFGLSRDIYMRDYYASDDKRSPLPVKWMAVESLRTAHYTTKSDVWSFGVLLWELMTRGAAPYPDVANWEIKIYIQDGRRLQIPPNCPLPVYELMMRTWLENPEARPSFAAIVSEIEELIGGSDDDDTNNEPLYLNLAANVEPAIDLYANSEQVTDSGGNEKEATILSK